MQIVLSTIIKSKSSATLPCQQQHQHYKNIATTAAQTAVLTIYGHAAVRGGGEQTISKIAVGSALASTLSSKGRQHSVFHVPPYRAISRRVAVQKL